MKNVDLKQKLARKIGIRLKNGKNLLMVGKTNSGKTRFVKKFLIPEIKRLKLSWLYFPNCNSINTKKIVGKDIVLVDEVEILDDEQFLKNLNKSREEYYERKYKNKVAMWHKKLKGIKIPGFYILTRNRKEEMDNIKKRYRKLEWNRKNVEIIIGN